MAKPRIFISSTYYDLKHIRNSIQAFVENYGYESVLFEEGDISFHHDSPLDVSCYEEIKNCHILVLIIGGRYGAPASEAEASEEDMGIKFYNSITKKEYETARKSDIPIYVFIEKNVHSEYHTYKKNRTRSDIEYAHVDNTNIFKLIDDIYSQKRNNLIKDFEKFDDIANWLRDQWAGLFADFLAEKSADKNLDDLSTQISGLQGISSVLKEYTETIMEKLQPENFESLIENSNAKLKQKRMERIFSSPLISYIRDILPEIVDNNKIYEAFEDSDSVEKFLRKLEFDEDYILDFIDKSDALQDYKHIKGEALTW
ncbi:DUF4062 domain-containing protein [Pseudoalteromonas sp. Of11M-6]|uniref:DUF4062 domain-containing protein n=1 Tax=Pseudoalteromonas sp. Of11M-6 TaxID=2917754 RepID=UPI001EF5C2DC|nr:DUF4062 domain-containing protein [Pseudoalteromonas sp. Of11M-6]